MKYKDLLKQAPEIREALGLSIKGISPVVNLAKKEQEKFFMDFVNLILSREAIPLENVEKLLNKLIYENPYLSYKRGDLEVKIENINAYARLNNYKTNNEIKYKISVNAEKIKTETSIANDKLISNLYFFFVTLLSIGHEYTHYLQYLEAPKISKDAVLSIKFANAFQSTKDERMFELRNKILKLFELKCKQNSAYSIYHTYPYEQHARNCAFIFLKTMVDNIAQCFKENGEHDKAEFLVTHANEFLQNDYNSRDSSLHHCSNQIKSQKFNIKKLSAVFNLISKYIDKQDKPNKTDEAIYKLFMQGDTNTIMENWKEYNDTMYSLYEVSNEIIAIFCANASLEDVSLLFKEFIKLGFKIGIIMLEESLIHCHNVAWADVADTTTLSDSVFKKEEIISLLKSDEVTEYSFKNIAWQKTGYINEEDYRNLVIKLFEENKFAYLQHMLNEDLTHDEEIVGLVYTAVENYIKQIQQGDKNINPYDYNYLCKICSQFDDRDIQELLSLLASLIEKFNETIKNQTEEEWYKALEKVYGEQSATDIDSRRRYSQDSFAKMEMYMGEVDSTNKILES